MNESRRLEGSRRFSVSPATLFEAFANPDSLINWWGPKGFSCTFETFDFRVGGEWIFVMHGPNGADYPNHIVFDEIVKNEKIVFRHIGAPKFTGIMLYETAEGGGSVLTWIHEFESEEIRNSIATLAENGREENFDRLAQAVNDPSALR